jgi:nucleotide-binding universal stress UspA family protein
VITACAPIGAKIKNVLFATDFSDASLNALTFALSLTRAHGATIHALHVITPEAYLCTTPETAVALEAPEESAQDEMDNVVAHISAVPNEAIIERATSVWAAVEETITRAKIDVLVLGTHGRTGLRKLLLGSTAEGIFRRARIPVLTIGPAVTRSMHSAGKYRCVLFAADLQEDSLRAAAFAFSLAEEQNAKLILFHVATQGRARRRQKSASRGDDSSAADILHQLHEMIPVGAEARCQAEVALKFGEPARQILEIAKERGADLIVMGTHKAARHLPSSTHLKRGVSYNVVIRSRCPVLTVRG